MLPPLLEWAARTKETVSARYLLAQEGDETDAAAMARILGNVAGGDH